MIAKLILFKQLFKKLFFENMVLSDISGINLKILNYIFKNCTNGTYFRTQAVNGNMENNNIIVGNCTGL